MDVMSFARYFFNMVKSAGFQKWIPLALGHVKVNFDAACLKSIWTFGIGIVAQNHIGECLAWKILLVGSSLDLVAAKIVASKYAYGLTCSFSWPCISIEGDCLGVINALNQPGANLSMLGTLVDEFLHLWRTANGVAHLLAKNASKSFYTLAFGY
ncbi:hypothetical protein CDL12_27012 [Handroanthus impetiginosus]|uniref:RNase H type-1 domain-containing protein n=1 Tax=Handroanthus impetiginosus TaxID=429701 RepID=A0A2G9G5S5_9LAMI|nr:hypothetical protein CDL12_27012 [Handroanthus impetiginosus]